ncbi:carboxylesterase family protein [Fibrella forsythiae]|uniref:Prolyl oligopeptidase family serine peptidase n=1 Tax=Fibrella forsythiae TaxID=2817061 RepID=A0ABS3JKH1_9BACT|nr:prolyl oligopeptidase family serine peptidase [Fibrella forsythiae]MBO0950512.1 prolyl oligopeptidase family serine peptidase [Fibrella forsythiae]
MIRFCTYLFCLLGGLSLPASAQSATAFSVSDSTLYLKKTFTFRRDYTLPYRMLEPLEKDTKMKYPLVVVLHGAGEKGTDNERQLLNGGDVFASLDNRLRFQSYVVFPQCPKPDNWTTFGFLKNPGEEIQLGKYDKQASEPLRATLALIDRLIADKHIDRNRVYIVGLSMGGFGALEALSMRPGLFAAAVPVCGGGDTTAVDKYARKVPLWLFHSQDDPIIPVGLSRAIANRLRTLKAEPQYTEYENAGRSSWRDAFADSTLLPWLFSQNRKQSGTKAQQEVPEAPAPLTLRPLK